MGALEANFKEIIIKLHTKKCTDLQNVGHSVCLKVLTLSLKNICDRPIFILGQVRMLIIIAIIMHQCKLNLFLFCLYLFLYFYDRISIYITWRMTIRLQLERHCACLEKHVDQNCFFFRRSVVFDVPWKTRSHLICLISTLQEMWNDGLRWHPQEIVTCGLKCIWKPNWNFMKQEKLLVMLHTQIYTLFANSVVDSVYPYINHHTKVKDLSKCHLW